MAVTAMQADVRLIGLRRSLNRKSNGAGIVTTSKHMRELTNQADELTVDELERVSGGTPVSKDPPPSGVFFLVFQFKLAAVKT
jgi:hypothetical protein